MISLSSGSSAIPASTAVTITFSANLKLGASATAGSSTGMTVQTLDGDGADYNACPGFATGAIGNVVLSPSFFITDSARLVGTVVTGAVLKFTTSAGGQLLYSATAADNGKITLNYPSGFFDTAATPVPTVAITGPSGVTATCGAPGATSLVISLSSGVKSPSWWLPARHTLQ